MYEFIPVLWHKQSHVFSYLTSWEILTKWKDWEEDSNILHMYAVLHHWSIQGDQNHFHRFFHSLLFLTSLSPYTLVARGREVFIKFWKLLAKIFFPEQLYLIWNTDVWLIQVSLICAHYFALINVLLSVTVVYQLWFEHYMLFEPSESNGILHIALYIYNLVNIAHKCINIMS